MTLTCWPSATTSDQAVVIGSEEFYQQGQNNLGDTLNDLPQLRARFAQEIVVSGSLVAVQEELGDLKLYRIPEPVTVAANGQKQVALLVRDEVPVAMVYRVRTGANATGDIAQAQRVLVTRNREQERLGVPLPAGPVAAFVSRAGAPFLIGQGAMADYAVGEEVEIEIGASPGVRVRQEQVGANAAAGWTYYQLVVTSDQARAIAFELELSLPADTRIASPRLAERDGAPLWTVSVPANGTQVLRYRLQRNRPRR